MDWWWRSKITGRIMTIMLGMEHPWHCIGIFQTRLSTEAILFIQLSRTYGEIAEANAKKLEAIL